MYNYSTAFMQSEIAYRADRARVGVAVKRRRAHTRSPLLRRQAGTGDSDR